MTFFLIGIASFAAFVAGPAGSLGLGAGDARSNRRLKLSCLEVAVELGTGDARSNHRLELPCLEFAVAIGEPRL